MAEQVTLTREQIYELVWAEPVSRLAKRYGLTDYKWRQLCVRMSIPVPREQHWRKLKMGDEVERPRLPAHYSGEQNSYAQRQRNNHQKIAETTNETATGSGKTRLSPEDPIVTQLPATSFSRPTSGGSTTASFGPKANTSGSALLPPTSNGPAALFGVPAGRQSSRLPDRGRGSEHSAPPRLPTTARSMSANGRDGCPWPSGEIPGRPLHCCLPAISISI